MDDIGIDELTSLMLYTTLKITTQTSTPQLNPSVCLKRGGSRHAHSLLFQPVLMSAASLQKDCNHFH